MKKDNYRDYVTDAFRYYAMCGKPQASELRHLRAMLPNAGSKGALADLEAVAKLIERLETEPDGELYYDCLNIVYFSNARRSPGRGELTERVQYAMTELSVSEATVYRMMRRLRTLMALERGLRIDERDLLSMSKR